MSDNVDALLGGEDDVGDYDLRDEDEDALLEDDGYEQSREINSVQEDQYEQQYDESGDVLELSAEELLNEDDEADFNDSVVEDTPRDKFNRERVEVPSSSIVPDTTTKITRKPTGAYQRGGGQNNRGRFHHRGMSRGSFRGGARGQGSQRGYQNVQNRNARPRPEAWVKKPMQVQPWVDRPAAPVAMQLQRHQQPLLQSPKPWVSDVQDSNNYCYNTPQANKPSVHQRLGYNQQPTQQQQMHAQYSPQPTQQFMQPPPIQMQPPQQIPFEQERIIASHPVHINPQQNYNQPQQYPQPPPMYNQPPPNQYGNQIMYQSPPNTYSNNYIPPTVPQQQQYAPQYNADPYVQPQQMQQQQVYQNDPGYYEPPPRIETYNVNVVNDGYNDGYNYTTPPPYNTNQQVQQQFTQPRIMRKANYTSPPSPQKRRMEFRKPYVEKELVQNKLRKVFENKNLHEVKTVENFEEVKSSPNIPTSTFIIDSKPIPNDEDEETRKYRIQIEKQKKLREELLARKEERRKLAAQKQQVEEAMKTIPSPKDLINKPPQSIASTPVVNRAVVNKPQKAPNVNQKAPNVNTNLRVLNPANTNTDAIKAFLNNRKIIAKDESLLETSIVVVSNLAAGTSEVKLRKICSGVGEIQKFELSPKERQATIQFNSVASAHAFYKKYQRFMLDLSMIKVTLKPHS